MAVLTGCKETAEEKLTRRVEFSNKHELPSKLFSDMTVVSCDYKNHKVVFNTVFDEDNLSLNDLREEQIEQVANGFKTMYRDNLSTASGEIREMLEECVEAGASIQLAIKGKTSHKIIYVTISPAEIESAISF